ncbi:MAG: TonB-dependent receptor plug domain-containing protein, partial [Acidobacteriota bacterium]|nr:TonB-dependent receptor plug domain-containing protein [Acidobacteriota bacterium]
MATRRVLGFLILIVLFGTLVVAQSTGRIGGQVVREDGSGVGGVVVVIAQTSAATLTDNNGNFSFSGVPAGTYAVTFTFGDQSTGAEDVVVKAGEETQIRQTVDWSISYAESLTVYSASRRQERIVEAPASISVISEQEIEREASHGQVPKLLEFTPGAEVTQSGIYDYNFNTRGFNSSLNRRVATLIDGRNASVPFLGAQEWAAVSFPLDDLASLEFVRGPSAALYGANASSGVLNLSTKSPRHSQGGTVRISGGELSTTNVDFRFANEAGAGWYYKVAGGIRNSGDFTVSRNGAAEYSVPCTMSGQTNCLPQEPLPLLLSDDDEISFGGVRFDKYFNDESVLTFEGGTADVQGPVFQSGIGRIQLIDVKRPWARFNYNREHLNITASYTAREADKQLALASAQNVALDTERIQFEVQTNWEFGDDRFRVVAGASHTDEDIDSLDPATGRQTLMFAPVSADAQ